VWFLSFFYLFSSPNLNGRRLYLLPHFHTWCGLSVNLECISEMCCTRLAENTERKNDAKNRHMRTIAPICRAISSQLRHLSTIGKKLLNSNMSYRCIHNMANFGLLSTEICWRVWGNPAELTGFASCLHYCSDVAHRRPTKLCTMFGRLLGCYIYIFGGHLSPDRILPGAKFTLRPSLAFSYIGSVTARHSSSGRQPNFAALYKEWN